MFRKIKCWLGWHERETTHLSSYVDFATAITREIRGLNPWFETLGFLSRDVVVIDKPYDHSATMITLVHKCKFCGKRL